MSLGQLLMIGFDGTTVSPELAALMRDVQPGGVILFARNCESPEQVRTLIADLTDAAEAPLIVGVDQEGGRVARLKAPFTELPPMNRIARAGSDARELAREVGAMLARELAAVGFTLDFAPVLDVNTNAQNPVINDRAFSADAQVVARLGCAFIEGMQGEGVAACGKHFPGHGDTTIDSHKGLPRVEHARERLGSTELVPFRAAIAASVASLMTAHLLVTAYDEQDLATTSSAITTGLLRKALGFEGLVFTDDLIMRGIADRYGTEESAWRAIAAGADVALVCEGETNVRQALDGLARALDDGKLDGEHIAASRVRIARFTDRFCNPNRMRPPMTIIGCPEHQTLAKRLHEL